MAGRSAKDKDHVSGLLVVCVIPLTTVLADQLIHYQSKKAYQIGAKRITIMQGKNEEDKEVCDVRSGELGTFSKPGQLIIELVHQ